MSFPRYPEYRGCDVAWIGEIPVHWSVKRIKHVLHHIGSGGTPDTSTEGYWADETGTPWVAIGDMSDREVVQNTSKALTLTGLESKKLTVWPSGTLLFSMYASLGHVAVLRVPAATNQAILALVPLETMHQPFLKRWFEFLRPHLAEQASSNTQDNLNAEKVKNLPVVAPPFPEQTAIANFLDHETAKIDALVAEQQKLIALLQEKRQAVISHVVTKGLDPNVPMKDSGVEWLGEVPEHWHVARLGYFATVENGTTPARDMPEYWLDGEIPWLASGEVNKLHIFEAEEFITHMALKRCSLRLLPIDTVVVGLIGQGKTRGMSALLRTPATINQNLAAVCPGSMVNSWYLLYAFHAMYDWLREAGRGGNQAAMNCEMLRSLLVPVPNLDEQAEIVAHVNTALAGIDKLSAETASTTKLLQERRTALISAAVTGQIDVHGLAGRRKCS